MILGYSLLIIALVATVAANVLFVLSRGQGKEGLAKIAQTGVSVALAGIVGASTYLMYLIGTPQFAFQYVAEYTSKQSATRYLIAAFWGGQEGSILLWLFWTALLGWLLARKSGKMTASVWPIFGLIQLYLLGKKILKGRSQAVGRGDRGPGFPVGVGTLARGPTAVTGRFRAGGRPRADGSRFARDRRCR